ncbi:MAG: DUF1460 domain-containing protein [Rhodothermales bacterium]|nr:DUF1460 domain-containing protein [Rhodothermales bacterium]
MVTSASRFRSLILFVLLGIPAGLTSCAGQANDTDKQVATSVVVKSDTVDAYVQLISSAASVLDSDQFGDAVLQAGLSLENRPYLAGLLDESDSEDLVIRLDGFDCVLLVETALASARAAARGDKSVSGFSHEIETLRYRNGDRRGYGSRLHYFTDWINDNSNRGIVEDITQRLGGVAYEHTLNFMSANRALYPKISDNDSLLAEIVGLEQKLKAVDFFYIPQANIVDAYPGIRSGDVIAITTSVPGLDISHTGIAYVEDGAVGFLHASTSRGVTVAPDLSTYVNNNAKQTGIMVARPLIPLDE